jgi:hypothetical protein
MAVMVFLPFCLKSCRAGGGGREREVFVEEGFHVCCCLGGGFVPEGTGFEFGENCSLSVSILNVQEKDGAGVPRRRSIAHCSNCSSVMSAVGGVV